jgi:hypothetical protein
MSSRARPFSALEQLQARRIAELEDALRQFANPQHWGVTRDLGEPVCTWIGTYRKSPVEVAREALGAAVVEE